jgi:hypothetical protein
MSVGNLNQRGEEYLRPYYISWREIQSDLGIEKTKITIENFAETGK